MPKRLFLGLLFLVTIFFLSSCVEKSDLTIWVTYSPTELKVFKKIVEKFEKNNNVKVLIAQLPWQGHQTKIKMSLIANSPPDIARIDIGFLPTLVSANVIQPLDNLLDKNIKDAMFDSVKKSATYNGKLYAVADQITTIALFYRKDWLRKNNLFVPRTLEELAQVAKALSDQKNNRYGIGLNLAIWWLRPILGAFKADYYNDKLKKVTIDTPQFIEALKYVKYLIDQGIEGKAWKTGGINPDVGFLNGRYAFIFSGPWNYERFKKAGIDFGITLIPAGPFGNATSLGGTFMCIFKDSKHKKLAAKFLNYLLSKKVQEFWMKQLKQIPVNRNVKPIDEVRIFFEELKYAKPRHFLKSYPLIETNWAPIMESILDGKVSIVDGVKILQKKVEEIIEKYEKIKK